MGVGGVCDRSVSGAAPSMDAGSGPPKRPAGNFVKPSTVIRRGKMERFGPTYAHERLVVVLPDLQAEMATETF